METTINRLTREIEELRIIKQNLLADVIELDDKILFQDFGVYEPQFAFASSEEYKTRLDEIRAQEKTLVKQGLAAKCYTDWKVNGSEKEGRKLIAKTVKLIIRNFNIECDICIHKVKFSNYESSEKRIIKAYEIQNELNETNSVEITRQYLNLKLKELALAYEYQMKREEEKEERRLLREQHREEERVAKEIEAKRLELEKEQSHYLNALKRVDEQIAVEKSDERKEFLIEKKEELKSNLIDVDKAMEELDYREANHRAGYVYIISNVGAFGPDVYKIGMTRRLEPEDRITELSGAAVPFRFDVHAMIFSDDAPKLEAALHNAFADKKINLVNGRKEFFRVSLEEIKKVVRENHDKTVDFIDVPEAEQFRESEMIRKHCALD